MQISSHFLVYLSIIACRVAFLPFVVCSSTENHLKAIKNSVNHSSIHKLSPKLKSEVAIHGVILWVSLGFLMPLGILIIRMGHREEGGRRKLFFYLHLIFQIIAVLLATAGAIMSIKTFENSFSNNHQRIGLALYVAIWIQAVIGFFRPLRGSKKRSSWYFVHWMLGTIISLAGIVNIYTGLEAYHKRISPGSNSRSLWTILFTAQVSFFAFFYLFQDKWEYMIKQGVILGDDDGDQLPPPAAVTPTSNQVINLQNLDNHKVLVPQPCAKKNALSNLFD